MSSIATLVIGPSGHGKSTSARNLDPSETVIISVTGKPLPFPKAREYSRENKNYFITKSASKIIKILDKLKGADHVKNIVIDD
jgi:adenylate kinase family enzyme